MSPQWGYGYRDFGATSLKASADAARESRWIPGCLTLAGHAAAMSATDGPAFRFWYQRQESKFVSDGTSGCYPGDAPSDATAGRRWSE